MALTYTAIATVTVGSGGAANIEFTSIPGTYTDLLVLLSVRASNSGSDNQLRININGTGIGTNFSFRGLQGSGSSASSGTSSTGYIVGGFNANTSTSNTFSSVQLYIPNYAGSTNKSMSIDSVMENNATTAYAELNAALYSNTSAITSLKFTAPSANLMQYSTATLYGISSTV